MPVLNRSRYPRHVDIFLKTNISVAVSDKLKRSATSHCILSNCLSFTIVGEIITDICTRILIMKTVKLEFYVPLSRITDSCKVNISITVESNLLSEIVKMWKFLYLNNNWNGLLYSLFILLPNSMLKNQKPKKYCAVRYDLKHTIYQQYRPFLQGSVFNHGII